MPSQQERGSRNARALPYELFVDAAQDLSASTITLSFINTGSVAAGFAVYSAGTPTSVKRYTVDANSKLSDSWRFAGGAAVASAYDLTVIAPNGFVRRFVSSGTSASSQEATVCYEVTAGDLAVNLVNTGKAGVTFRITDNRYGVAAQSVSVAAGQTVQVPWSLAASKRWYDLGITCDADARFLRQFAGHVEIGAPGVTDPSMA